MVGKDRPGGGEVGGGGGRASPLTGAYQSAPAHFQSSHKQEGGVGSEQGPLCVTATVPVGDLIFVHPISDAGLLVAGWLLLLSF